MEIIRRTTQIDVIKLADYILSQLGEMSHLKLQKLIYMVEGYHLAYFGGESLVGEKFQAWTHGPVCRKVFDILKDTSILYGDVRYEQADGEIAPKEILKQNLSSEQMELIDEVLSMYAHESGISLEGITHKQFPWLNARNGLPYYAKCENIISTEDMRQYFETLIEG